MIEEKLIEQCKKEDRLAQKELYETYCIEMKRLMMRYVNDENDAFDCLSKGFYKVLTKIHQFEFKGKGSLSAWIRKIMINEALVKLRDPKEKLLLYGEEILQKQESEDLSYGDVDASHIYKCIQELPVGARTIFNLVAVEGYSHKEVASILKIKESTSRSQLTFARNKLKETLKSRL